MAVVFCRNCGERAEAHRGRKCPNRNAQFRLPERTEVRTLVWDDPGVDGRAARSGISAICYACGFPPERHVVRGKCMFVPDYYMPPTSRAEIIDRKNPSAELREFTVERDPAG